jgi:hypothetical protein
MRKPGLYPQIGRYYPTGEFYHKQEKEYAGSYPSHLNILKTSDNYIFKTNDNLAFGCQKP